MRAVPRTFGAATKSALPSSRKAWSWKTALRARFGAAPELPRLVGELSGSADGGQLHEPGSIVVARAEIDHVSADVEVLHRIERLHQAFAGRIRARTADGLREDFRADEGLQ